MNVLVHPEDSVLREIASETGANFHTDARAVHLRLLLHLPRLAGTRGEVAVDAARAEARRLAARLPSIAAWKVRDQPKLADLRLTVVADSLAAEICQRFHYLGSHRQQSRCYGFVSTAGHPAALAVTTDCDVDVLRRCALDHFDDASPRVLARVFAFDGAPTNTLSRLFRLVREEERELGTQSLVTYVNPNMGFSGSSYRASNWVLLGDEPGTTYRYLDGQYMTDRELARCLNRSKADDNALRTAFGPRYERSEMLLQPLQIFGTLC